MRPVPSLMTLAVAQATPRRKVSSSGRFLENPATSPAIMASPAPTVERTVTSTRGAHSDTRPSVMNAPSPPMDTATTPTPCSPVGRTAVRGSPQAI